MTPFPFQKMEVSSESPAHAEFRKGIAALVKGELKTADQTFRAAAKMDHKLAAPHDRLFFLEKKISNSGWPVYNKERE